MSDSTYLVHHGVLGMHWGIRRYQNSDGSLTEEGKKHYGNNKIDLSSMSNNEIKQETERIRLENEYYRQINEYDKLTTDQNIESGKNAVEKISMGQRLVDFTKNVSTIANGVRTVKQVIDAFRDDSKNKATIDTLTKEKNELSTEKNNIAAKLESMTKNYESSKASLDQMTVNYKDLIKSLNSNSNKKKKDDKK